MVDLVIVGSVAFDNIKTPFGAVSDALGGSATYASLAASFFSKPGIVAVVGEDFDHKDVFHDSGVSTDGLKTVDGKTFRWSGYYEYDMNQAHTTDTQLNVFENFRPELPDDYKGAKCVFLANIDPELQLHVLNQMKNPTVIMDTMNYWIEKKREQLLNVIKKSNILLINDAEARELFETTNLITAGKKALGLGLDAIVIKKGEHGALLFTKDRLLPICGYPLENVKDPTGAGDSFAGALSGYLACNNINQANLCKAVVYGSAVASYNVEDFSFNNLKKINIKDIETRFKEFKDMTTF